MIRLSKRFIAIPQGESSNVIRAVLGASRCFGPAAGAFALAFLLLASNGRAQAQVFLSSYFNTNAEGWVVINWDHSCPLGLIIS